MSIFKIRTFAIFFILYSSFFTGIFANSFDLSNQETSTTQQKHFSRLYIFGDSLSDIGNTYDLLLGALPESPPYYNGRFSNGPVWVEALSKKLNLPPQLVINYAFGGARAIQDPLPVPSFEKQVTQYIKYNSASDPNALYVVWIGANDVMNDVEKPNYMLIMQNISTRVTAQLRILINHGAKTFFIPNLPNISSTPLAQEKDELYRNKKYSSHIDEMTLLYNSLLAESLQDLQVEFPDVRFINFDTYSIINESSDVLKNAGVKYLTNRCNKNWFVYNLFPTCSNPQEYLFWDTVHPTETVHSILSQLVLQALQENGYAPHERAPEVTPYDITIMNNNIKAIKGLTSKKLDLFDKELLFRQKMFY